MKHTIKTFTLTIALLFSTAITSSCTYKMRFAEVIKPDEPVYLSVKETVYYRDYLAITPNQKYQLVKTKNNKTFVANLDGRANIHFGIDESLCLDGSHLLVGNLSTEIHSIENKEAAEKAVIKLFGKIPCFSIVE